MHIFRGLWGLLFMLTFASSALQAEGTALLVPTLAQGIPLGNSLFYLEDKSGGLDLKAIRKRDADFRQAGAAAPNFGFSNSAFWAKFTLSNSGTTPQDIFLEYGYANVDIVELYYPNEAGAWQVKLSGDQLPGDLREVPYRLPAFRIALPPGDTTYYLRIHTEGACQLPLQVWSVDAFHNKRVTESSFLALLYGFLVVMALYNTFLAISVRSWSHFVYVIFILNSLFHFMGIQGLFFFFVPDRIAPWMNNKGFVTTAGCAVMTACLFSRSFLDLHREHRRLYWVVSFAAFAGFMVMVVTQFSYGIGSRLAVLSGIISTVSVLTASAVRMFRKYRPAYFFTLAWSCSIIGYFFYMLATAGLIPVNMIGSWGPFLGVSFEVVMISLAMGDKLRLQQETSERQIRDLNENLEKKVEEKTRDIRSIMANIKLGIVSIVGQDLRIDKEYSASMESLFHEKDLEGRKALDLLFRDAHLPADVMAMMESALVASIGEDAIAMESNIDCFVREVSVDQNGEKKVMELDWNPMHGKHQTTEKILVTVRDVTDIHEYQEAMQQQRRELEQISELIKVPVETASKFFVSSYRFLEENRGLIQQNASSDALRILFVNMHTLKGSARSLGLKELAALCHDVEQFLVILQKNLSRWDSVQLLDEQDRVARLLNAYQEINDKKLNRSKKSETDIAVPRQEIIATIHDLDRIEQETNLLKIQTAIDALRRQAISHVFERAEDLIRETLDPVAALARDLGKEEPRFTLQLLEFGISREAADALRNAMIHILRNAMDHGIESPSERRLRGKAEQGAITITMRDEGDELTLHIKDDGRGLALRAIEQVAIYRSLIPRNHSLSHHAIGSLIFESTFTTSKTVTDLSGRGVGMEAVRKYMGSIGGQVDLMLEGGGFGPLPEFASFYLAVRVPARYVRRLGKAA